MILITGGARSGKSLYAERLALEIGEGRATYIATAEVLDDEMAERVAIHKSRRGGNWETIEAPFRADEKILEAGAGRGAILFDCVTMYISNLICADSTDEEILRAVDGIICAAEAVSGTVIFVSNEVGCGIVPENKLARRFRDLAGLANQRIAARSDKVILMVAGIAVEVKNVGRG